MDIGDRVRTNEELEPPCYRGLTGVILKQYDDKNSCDFLVKFDEAIVRQFKHPVGAACFNADELEIINETHNRN